MGFTVGVLALQGGFAEHLDLLRSAAQQISTSEETKAAGKRLEFTEVRTVQDLERCDALVIPGGESTTISFVAAQSGLLEPLRDFVKIAKKPVWGTCAGLILLSEQANAAKKGGQELIGGLGVRVHRNHFGRQIESFECDLDLPFLEDHTSLGSSAAASAFPGVFIRAPVVEAVLSTTGSEGGPSPTSGGVEVLAKLPGRVGKAKPGAAAASQAVTVDDAGDIIAVRQGNVFGTSFHPELTTDSRIHVWWLQQILQQIEKS